MIVNLRTLKKLSKRAAPLLAALGDTREQFRAERHDNYTSTLISERKHWDRSRCHASYEPRNNWSGRQGHEVVAHTRSGHTLVLRPPSHPRKGTVMVGAVSGYYEPEWDEETAWDSLLDLVHTHFTDWGPRKPQPTRTISSVADVFRAADDMRAELAKAA